MKTKSLPTKSVMSRYDSLWDDDMPTDYHRAPAAIMRLNEKETRAVAKSYWTGKSQTSLDKMYDRARRVSRAAGGLVHVVNCKGAIIATV